jgi:peptide/nickel transport system substrate-binding protein
MNYKSPKLDTLIDQARQTVDESKRMDIWKQAHAVIHEDQPYTFLFFPKTLIFVDKRIHNVQTVKLGLNSRTEWFIPKDQQR